ncbi:hypothetical protein WS86_19885 [Burkholderia savannae]|nr:hypothetical protein WS86_19885 [Burkholderia savannae]
MNEAANKMADVAVGTAGTRIARSDGRRRRRRVRQKWETDGRVPSAQIDALEHDRADSANARIRRLASEFRFAQSPAARYTG